MTGHLLVDPAILIPPRDADIQQMARFWERLVAWGGDRRLKVGPASHTLTYEYFAQFGYPQDSLHFQPASMRGSYVRAINTILSRVSHGDDGEIARDFSPPYVGAAEAAAALAKDVAASCREVLGLATVRESWADGRGEVACSPVPPDALALCLEPNQEILKDLLRDVAISLKGCRLHLLGGQVDEVVMRRIGLDFGLSGRIEWIPSEKNKPPRNLDRRWAGLDPARDITVCITGRIGHSASGKAEKICRSKGVPHIQIESINSLEAALLEHYRDSVRVD